MRSKPESFIILTPGFPRDEAEDNCLPLQQLLVKRIKAMYPQLSVHVLSFQYPFQSKEYEWYNCSVKAFGGKSKGGIRKWLLRRRILGYLQQLHNEEEIRGILSFWLGECAAVGKLFSQRTQLPHRCWLMGQDARAGNRYVKDYSFGTDELISLSDSIQAELDTNYSLHSVPVIYPAVDETLFEAVIPFRDIDVLAAGSLIPLKQIHLLVPMMQQWKMHAPQLRVVIAGKGPEEQKIKKQIKAAGLQAHVLFPGELPHAELIQLMQRSKMLVHPSSYEGFSGVCMEALRAGCSVVSFTKGCTAPVKNWHVVKDEAAMETTVSRLLQDPFSSEPVTICSAEETIPSLMKLFGL